MQEYISQTPVASIIFVFTLITSLYAFSNQEVYGKLMFHPYSVSRGERVWSLLTSGLVHRDWAHLFFNMFTFYAFAFTLERILVANSSWGHIQFALIYIVSLVLSDVSTLIKHKEDFWYNSLGASGAICAVLFSYILFHPWDKIELMFIPIGIPAFLFGFIYLGYCVYAARYSRDSINHDAHFYGALTGILMTIILYPPIVGYFVEQLSSGGK